MIRINDYCSKHLRNRTSIVESNIECIIMDFNRKLGMLIALFNNTNIDREEYNIRLENYLDHFKITPINVDTIEDTTFLKNYEYREIYQINKPDKDISNVYVLLDKDGVFLSTDINDIFVKSRY